MPAKPRDYREPNFVIVGTTHIGAFITGDRSIVLAMTNDGLTARSPGLQPDQAQQIVDHLTAAIAQSRALSASQPAAKAT
mgnify:CR=1 FL=1